MKRIFTLSCILFWGAFSSLKAQDYASAKTMENSSATKRDAGEITTLFNTEMTATRYGGCSLIQNKKKDRQVFRFKTGYKMVTENGDETVKVKYPGNGGRKLIYSNDFETLKYHLDKNGKVHYTYAYYNGCSKVKVRRDKEGITTVHNKSGMDSFEVQSNVQEAIQRGANTCASATYAR